MISTKYVVPNKCAVCCEQNTDIHGIQKELATTAKQYNQCEYTKPETNRISFGIAARIDENTGNFVMLVLWLRHPSCQTEQNRQLDGHCQATQHTIYAVFLVSDILLTTQFHSQELSHCEWFHYHAKYLGRGNQGNATIATRAQIFRFNVNRTE